MLTYTLDRLLTEQAQIERNMASFDAYGAQGAENWQPFSTVPCRLVWDRGTGIRSPDRVYVSPARVAPLDEGLILVPLGTDVTQSDRITQINARDPLSGAWSPYVTGVFQIVAVLVQEGHMELNVLRTVLGA